MRRPLASGCSHHAVVPGSTGSAACCGPRIVKPTPSSTSTASTSSFTAVSGSHIPSARRPKRCSKSASPQRISVRMSRARGEREDRVVVGLRDRGAGVAVRGDHPVVGRRCVPRQPRRQRRADVEAEQAVVVHDRHDHAVVVDDPGEGVGPVALGLDALVPVVERRGRRLDRHLLGPGVLAGRLVEVPVDREVELAPLAHWCAIQLGKRVRGVDRRGAPVSRSPLRGEQRTVTWSSLRSLIGRRLRGEPAVDGRRRGDARPLLGRVRVLGRDLPDQRTARGREAGATPVGRGLAAFDLR